MTPQTFWCRCISFSVHIHIHTVYRVSYFLINLSVSEWNLQGTVIKEQLWSLMAVWMSDLPVFRSINLTQSGLWKVTAGRDKSLLGIKGFVCVCVGVCVWCIEKNVCVCLSFCDYACVTAWLILLLNTKTHPHTHVSYFPFLLIFFKSSSNLLSLLLGHILINSFYSPVHPSLLPSDSLFSLKCYFNNFFALCSVASLFQSQPVSYCNLCSVSSEAFFHISHSDLTGQYYDKRSITGRGHPCVCVYMRIVCVCVCVCVCLCVCVCMTNCEVCKGHCALALICISSKAAKNQSCCLVCLHVRERHTAECYLCCASL